MTSQQIAALIESSCHIATTYRSRAYGYGIRPGKPIEIIPMEAEVIRRVFASKDLLQLANELRNEGIRNRSGRLFTAKYLRSLIRNYYTGSEGIYPAIVSECEYRSAKKRLTFAHTATPRG